MSAPSIERLLVPKFPQKHVSASIAHFAGMTHEFQKRQWDNSIAKGGKFVEAVLKSLHQCALGQPAPTGKAFKADRVINTLLQTPNASADDTIRVLIPRACRFVYDIASNRGGRHDPDEIDANEMDSTTVVANCSWILAEMIRFTQKCAVDLTEARNVVVSLLEKKYSLIEEVELLEFCADHFPKPNNRSNFPGVPHSFSDEIWNGVKRSFQKSFP